MAHEDTRLTWNQAFLQALEHDTWGQVEEALDGYHRLQVATAAEHVENVLGLPPGRRAVIGAVATALQLRIQELRGGGGSIGPGVELEGMRRLRPTMAGLITTDITFPAGVLPTGLGTQQTLAALSVAAATTLENDDPYDSTRGSVLEAAWGYRGGRKGSAAARGWRANGGAGRDGGMGSQLSAVAAAAAQWEVLQQLQPAGEAAVAAAAAAAVADAGGGTLRPMRTDLPAGESTLVIYIDAWALKDGVASTMVQPHVTLTVRDAAGGLLEAVQDTPPPAGGGAGVSTDGRLVWGGLALHMQTPLGALPSDAALFLELRHYKPAKRKKSVRCWALLELEEVRAALAQAGKAAQVSAALVAAESALCGGGTGKGKGVGAALALEAYRKPVDISRRHNPVLLSVKPLYLHLRLVAVQH